MSINLGNRLEYDILNKNCVKNFYKLHKKAYIDIKFSKSLMAKIKQVSNKKADFFLKLLIITYFLFARKPHLKYINLKQKV